MCATLALVCACSTLAPEPEMGCESDEDCAPDEVCELEFGPACYPANQVAPLADLAFVVCEPQLNSGDEFCSELRGCDHEVKRGDPNEVELRRSRLSDTLALSFGTIPEPGQQDEDALVPHPAQLKLTQPSRLQRSGLEPTVQFALPEDPEAEAVPVTLSWPYYHPEDSPEDLVASLRALVVEVTPKSPTEEEPDIPELAPYVRMLLRPSARQQSPCSSNEDCESYPNLCIDLDEGSQCSVSPGSSNDFTIKAADGCHRRLSGQVVQVRGEDLVGVDGVTVDLAYAKDPAVPVGLAPIAVPNAVLPCSEDADCLAGQLCDPNRQQCVLDLGGRKAAKTVTAGEGVVDGEFTLLAYTYCEEGPVPSREFTLSTTGGASAGLPDMSYTFEQTFPDSPGGSLSPVEPPGKVCLPDWRAPDPEDPVTLDLTGNPRTLLGEGDASWTCCSTSCLPTSAPEGPFVPVQETGCFGATGSAGAVIKPELFLEASLLMEDVEGWEDLGCLPIEPKDAEAGVAAIMRTTPACTESPCTFDLGRGPAVGLASYRLRVEPPVGSVLASRVVDVHVVNDWFDRIGLSQRPIIKGVVRLPGSLCDDDAGDCGAERAVVMAERLRMPTEDPAGVLAPYFYSAETFYDPITQTQGAFVLPVNPGVYVFTVLPAGVRNGGPAPFQVIDMREQSETHLEITLDLGVTVSMRMRGFDRDASVLPLDTGTWSGIDHPEEGTDRKLDLNDPDECYPVGGTQGCKIRALVREDARLLLNQVDETGFIARKGSAACGS